MKAYKCEQCNFVFSKPAKSEIVNCGNLDLIIDVCPKCLKNNITELTAILLDDKEKQTLINAILCYNVQLSEITATDIAIKDHTEIRHIKSIYSKLNEK